MHWWVLFLLNWLVSAIALMVTAWLVPGFTVRGFGSAMIAVVIIGLANALVKPILFILTLPLTVLTFGLFYFFLNAIVLRLCSALVDGFEINGWISALLGALILSIANQVLVHALL